MLLVDTVEATEPFARQTSRNLSGLAQVCVFRRGVADERGTLLGKWGMTFPREHAYLVWPGEGAPPKYLGRVDSSNWRSLLTEITSELSGLSVKFRSSNDLLKIADRAARESSREDFSNRIRATGEDDNAKSGLLEDRVRQLDAEVEQWERFASDLVDENSQSKAENAALEKQILGKERALKDQANQIDELTHLLEALQQDYGDVLAQLGRLQAAYARKDRAIVSSQELGLGAPALCPGDLEPLAKFLESETEGAIVFTPNAKNAWRNCNYPFTDDMKTSLITLAKCAAELRNNEGFSTQGMQADDWFKERGLHISMTDGGLRKRGFHEFEFQGETYSQLPHVKLRDFDTAAHIGRIYFAFDPRSRRLIVNHVGVKLYGGPEKATRKPRPHQRASANGNGHGVEGRQR